MPTVYRFAALLVCAVVWAANIHSAPTQGIAQGIARGILDGPRGEEELHARQKAWVKTIVKRRNFASEEQLRAQLRSVPDVGLDERTADQLRTTLASHAAANQPSSLLEVKKSLTAANRTFTLQLDDPLPEYVGIETLKKLASSRGQPELVALPWQPTDAQQLNSSLARSLQETALHLHARLARLPKEDLQKAKLETLRTKLWGQTADEKWDEADCIPAITQILQAQPTLVRTLLVEQLAKIPGSASSEALAQRALFDLSPQVREQAVAALKSRPVHEYQKTLLSGFRWPWRPVTEHSAEAIATLQLQEMVKQLTAMLQEPDPALPFEKVENGERVLYVKELVKMNHAQNCLLCHPQSLQSGDLVRGAVPSPGQRMSSYARKSFHGGTVMVRADNTTLRQEFSVMHLEGKPSAENSELEEVKLPTQRYDYFLRERRATAEEIKRHQEREKGARPGGFNVEREAVLFALHSLGQ